MRTFEYLDCKLKIYRMHQNDFNIVVLNMLELNSCQKRKEI